MKLNTANHYRLNQLKTGANHGCTSTRTKSIRNPKPQMHRLPNPTAKTQHIRQILVQGLLPFSENIPRIPSPRVIPRPQGDEENV